MTKSRIMESINTAKEIKKALEGDTKALQTIYPEIGNLYLDGTINSDEFYKINKNHRVMVDNIMALFN